METQHDIKRLQEIVKLMEEMEKIFEHMDSDEYDRTRKYVYSRHDISLPNSLPN